MLKFNIKSINIHNSRQNRCKKYISDEEIAPTIHILKNVVVEINSQHPYLLGFNSNLIPNSSNFIISAISPQRFRVFGTIRKIHRQLSVFSGENPE